MDTHEYSTHNTMQSARITHIPFIYVERITYISHTITYGVCVLYNILIHRCTFLCWWNSRNILRRTIQKWYRVGTSVRYYVFLFVCVQSVHVRNHIMSVSMRLREQPFDYCVSCRLYVVAVLCRSWNWARVVEFFGPENSLDHYKIQNDYSFCHFYWFIRNSLTFDQLNFLSG